MKGLFKALRKKLQNVLFAAKKFLKSKTLVHIYSDTYHLNVFSDISIRLFSK